MRARYYDPVSGRFLSEDPSMQGANWFAYCGNDPLNKVDQSGKTPEDDVRSVILNLASNAIWAFAAKYLWPSVLKLAVSSLEAAQEEAFRLGYNLMLGGKIEMDEGAVMLRAGEAAEDIAPYAASAGAQMMLGGASKIVAGFAMQQFGYALLLVSL